MHLPVKDNLPINKLASVFGSTSATYKYYWLIAIIELVEEGGLDISKRKLFSRMISNSWYTINYFKISFGKQDKLQIAVNSIIKENSNLCIDIKKTILEHNLERTTNKTIINQLSHFDKNVPHWFLSPWFPKINGESDAQQKNRIYDWSKSFSNETLYALHKDYISINPIWLDYLTNNAKLLKDYCYWNLALFLQSRNPNVPDIPNKLIKPAIRSGLTKQTNEYWKIVFNELGSINCIFTDTKLFFNEKNYALDHFVPHAFVSHDLIWNLIPIEKKFNSSKSDDLPVFEKHFDKFFDLQEKAFKINKYYNAKNKYLEDYLTIFPDINSFEKQKFSNTIQPLITIANNNGFRFMKNI